MKLKLVLPALALCAVAAFAQTAAPDSTLAAYVQESWQNHPDIQSMRAMIAAEENRTRMNSAWMNPELRFGLMNVPQSFDTHMDPNTMWQIGLMQQVPFPGKLSASAQAGTLRTKVAEATVDETRFQMAAMVAMAYYDLAATLAVRKVLEHGKELANEMTEAASVMVSTGMGTQSEVMRSRLEAESWNVKLTNNLADISRKRAALAYALGRDVDSTLANPVLPEGLPPEIALDSALQRASIDNTPALKRLALESGAARADVRRARLDYWPDVTLGLSYGLRGYLRTMSTSEMTGITTNSKIKQDPMISLELAAPLPLFYKGNQRAKVRELSAMQSSREAELAKARLTKEQELRDLYARWKQSVDCCRIEQGKILPQTEDTWRAVLIDYRAGKAPFVSLSEARMKVVMAEMDVIMHKADGWAVYRQWQAALGKGL
ncbi:MAG TPA: TolC family protein [bacterium]|jgi:outer membrane protein TolC